MHGGTAVKGIRVEVARHDRWIIRNAIEQKLHLSAAALCGREYFQMCIRNCEDATGPTLNANDKCVAVALAFLHALRMIEARWQQKILRIHDRKTRECGVALDGCRVLAESKELIATAFGQFSE